MLERSTGYTCLTRYPYVLCLQGNNAKLHDFNNIHIDNGIPILTLAHPWEVQKAAHPLVVRIASQGQQCQRDIASFVESEHRVSSRSSTLRYLCAPLQKVYTSGPTTRTRSRRRSRLGQLGVGLANCFEASTMRLNLPTIVTS